MALMVMKFGGSSVATPELVLRAAQRVVSEAQAGHQVVVVVSAMGDQTDQLIALAKQIHPEPDPREMDMLLAVGEQMSVALMAIAIHKLGHQAISLTGAQAGIRTDSVSTKARIRRIHTGRLKRELAQGKIVIVAGFQGVDRQDNITTLGRGGSDTTAVALAAALKADRCDIFTDVDGVFTADPRLVPDAQWLPRMDYDELLELASLGAQVMHSRAVELAKRFGVPFRVRPSMNYSEGTLVTNLTDMEAVDVRAVALDMNEAKITMRDVPDKPGVAATIFSELAKANVNVDMIVQNVSAKPGRADLSFTVMKSDLSRALATANRLAEKFGGVTVDSTDQIAKVSAVGTGMRSHCGVAEKMFRALAKEKINIMMISTSEIKISCVVEASAGQRALRAVHRAFELNKPQVTAK